MKIMDEKMFSSDLLEKSILEIFSGGKHPDSECLLKNLMHLYVKNASLSMTYI